MNDTQSELAIQLERTREITLEDERDYGYGVDIVISATVQELGEFARAVDSEDGRKPRDLDESSADEGVDLIVCALAAYYIRHGTTADLPGKIGRKLDKWVANRKKRGRVL